MQSVNLKQMRIISIVWGFVMFLLVAGLTAVGFIYKRKTEEYHHMEQELVEIARIYIENKNIEIEDTLKLTKEELLDQMDEKYYNCDAYVIIRNKNTYQYKSYIKCEKYKTKDYEKNA